MTNNIAPSYISTQAFTALDADADGWLTEPELAAGLQEVMGLSPAAAAAVFASVDTGGQGLVSCDDFIGAAVSRSVFAQRVTLRRAFDQLDTDGSGVVELSELRASEADMAPVLAALGDADGGEPAALTLEVFEKLIRWSDSPPTR